MIHSLEVYVVGLPYYDTPRIKDWIQKGMVLGLVREPANAHDPNAVAVTVAGAELKKFTVRNRPFSGRKRLYKLGYLARGYAQIVAPVLDRGVTLALTADESLTDPNMLRARLTGDLTGVPGAVPVPGSRTSVRAPKRARKTDRINVWL